LDEPYRLAPIKQKVPENDSQGPEMKRKMPEGVQRIGEMSHAQLQDEVIRGLRNENAELKKEGLNKEESYLKKEREVLDITEQLHKEEGTAIEINKKLLRQELEPSTALNALREAYRGVKSAKLTIKEALLEEQKKIKQKDDIINDISTKIVKLQLAAMADQEVVADLQDKLQQAQQAHQALAKPVSPPEPLESHKDQHYLHSESPRGSALPKDFRPSRNPSTYGSNSHWDLGLCHTHSFTTRKCQVQLFEWHQSPPTYEESIYTRGLEPRGLGFLQWYDDLARGIY
jgi:hypothetical protein